MEESIISSIESANETATTNMEIESMDNELDITEDELDTVDNELDKALNGENDNNDNPDAEQATPEDSKADDIKAVKANIDAITKNLETMLKDMVSRVIAYKTDCIINNFDAKKASEIHDKIRQMEIDVYNKETECRRKKTELAMIDVDDNAFEAKVAECRVLKSKLEDMKKAVEAFKADNAEYFKRETMQKGVTESFARVINCLKSIVPVECMNCRTATPRTAAPSAPRVTSNWKLEAIKNQPGITYAELTSIGETYGHLKGSTPEATVRSDIRRLVANGLVRVDNGKIFLA